MTQRPPCRELLTGTGNTKKIQNRTTKLPNKSSSFKKNKKKTQDQLICPISQVLIGDLASFSAEKATG